MLLVNSSMCICKTNENGMVERIENTYESFAQYLRYDESYSRIQFATLKDISILKKKKLATSEKRRKKLTTLSN